VETEICLLYGISAVSSKHILQRNEKILLAATSALLEFNYIYWFQKFEFYFGDHFLINVKKNYKVMNAVFATTATPLEKNSLKAFQYQYYNFINANILYKV
jgi:hypothetical protein